VLDETTSSTPTDKFTAWSHNILCDKYATRKQYGYVPERVLKWEFRRELILNEVRDHDADIVCLQELDKYSYDEFFRSKLSYNGYKAYYAQKARAETLGEHSKFVDGCGTFWKDKKYVCLDTQHIIFGRKAVQTPGAKASADMLNRVWPKDNIATVTFLENRQTGSRLIVVNAHIFWDPTFKDVKLIQVAVLLEELAKIAEQYVKTPPCTNKAVFRFSGAEDADEPMPEPGPSLEYSSASQIPMLICGDFNSSPGSAVYNLLAHGELHSQHSDFSSRSYGHFSDTGMSHPFTLKSSYGSLGELSFTNYTPNFTDVLDYIWFSSNTLRVMGLLGDVDKEYLQRVPGFPNFHFPSDHLALMGEFSVVHKKPAKVVEADFGPSRDRT
jgi:CCR4-NOT transcription complex subunit 6